MGVFLVDLAVGGPAGVSDSYHPAHTQFAAPRQCFGKVFETGLVIPAPGYADIAVVIDHCYPG